MKYEIPEEKINPKDYWKCHHCEQIIEDNFDICWNCQSSKPNNFEIPSLDEILKNNLDNPKQLNEKKYWKCPKCGQIIESYFSQCWNCETYRPKFAKHPSVSEIIKYNQDKTGKKKNKYGILIILIGVITFNLSGISPISFSRGVHKFYFFPAFIGIFTIIIGVFVVYLERQKNKFK